jgi:DNA-binding IclR family transcriptional regulator
MIKPKTRSPGEEKKGKSGGEDAAVSSIARAANVLLCLSQGLNTVTDISLQCKLSKSTVHRLLNSLIEPRFTMYDSINHRYFLGPLITQLAASSEATHQPLIIGAADQMQLLSNVTGETVTLTLMVGLEFVRLYSILSKHGLKVEEPEDDRDLRPFLPSGAMQKVLLSQLNEKDLKIALRSFANWSTRHDEVIDTGRLLIQLAQIKQEGFFVSCGEMIPGCICLSAPVSNYLCPAALSIIGPETRISPNLARLTENLKTSAGRISTDLAHIFS